MNYIIGVDGGGTKTEAAAYSMDGEELGKGYAGFGNLLLGFNEGCENIKLAIKNCIENTEKHCSNSKCLFIYLGLAGIEAGDIKNKLELFLEEELGVKAKAVNDAEIAMAALLKGKNGILTISGTGSISYGKNNGKMERTGGWGHLIGDQGSGYYIAIQAFKNMTVEKDLSLPCSSLSRAIMKKLSIEKIDDIKGFIYSSNKGDIASFSTVVEDQAKLGDKTAKGILYEAGKDLAANTFNLYKKLHFNGHVCIGIKGSILTKVKPVRDAFEENLKKDIKEFTIIDQETSPAKGAFYLAKKLI